MGKVRIIAESVAGHWSAWMEDAPHTAFGGATAAESILRLLKVNGLDPENIEADLENSQADRQVFYIRPGAPCPDCGGSGQYVGMAVVETCGLCGGTGRIQRC